MNEISVIDFYTNKKLDVIVTGNDSIFNLKSQLAISKDLDPATYDIENVLLCNGRIVDGSSLLCEQDIENESILLVLRNVSNINCKTENDNIEHVYSLLNLVQDKRNVILKMLSTPKHMRQFIKLARGDYFIIRMLSNFEGFTGMDREDFIQISKEHIHLNEIAKEMLKILKRDNYTDLNEYIDNDEYNIDSIYNAGIGDMEDDSPANSRPATPTENVQPPVRPPYITNEVFQQVIGSLMNNGNLTQPNNPMDVPETDQSAVEMPEQEITEKLEIMRDYGITDMNRGRDALIMFNGDVESALSYLFENMDTN